MSNESVAEGLRKIHDLSPEEKKSLRKKVYDYAHTEFSHNKTVDLWHNSMLDAIKEFKEYKTWDKFTY